jgi:cell division protein FtsB
MIMGACGMTAIKTARTIDKFTKILQKNYKIKPGKGEKTMKKLTIILVLVVFVFYTTAAFALTDAQRTEQRRQQQSAQRAYQASASTYDDVSRQAGTYKQGAEIIRDTAAEGAYYGSSGRVDVRSNEEQ